AISLILNFPAELLQITGVSMDENEVQPSWTVNGNELRIGWNNLQPLWLEANGNLMTIHMVTSEAFSQGESIRFELAADPLNELADGNSNVIPDAVIGMDAIEFSAYGIGEPSDGTSISMQARPNPFADYTTLTYGIPANGHVTLQVNDMIGRKVSVLVDEYQSIGNYSVKLDAVPLQPGIYTATMTLHTGSGDMLRTIKLVSK
ncbi:MAG: T9SS type A sorting domain-containing protein, partial [Bacteroidales bacterium]|nr:T9SS type A sorting domain-containing protein [Bacteroidales bacterium]